MPLWTTADQTDEVGVDQAALEQARAAAEEASPTVTGGIMTKVVSRASEPWSAWPEA